VFTQGQQVSFSIVVTNTSSSASATNVTLTDTLPSNGGLTWTTGTTTQGTCTITGGNALSCSLGTLAPLASATVTVTSPTSTPAGAGTSQPNPAAIATADGGLTAQDGGSLSCTPPPPTPCPAGSFTFFYSANGDLNMVFDQFPAPNDNSYGVNAVGWTK